jgi:hypothetical protein
LQVSSAHQPWIILCGLESAQWLTELLAVEGIFLLRGFGFAEVSAEEFKSVLLHRTQHGPSEGGI